MESRFAWRRLTALTTAFSAIAALAVGGCADQPAPTATTASTAPSVVTQPIINGFAPDAPRHDATVALLHRSASTVYPDIYCTGTLVTPDVVVTAAHCLTSRKGNRIVTTPASSVAIYVGDATYSDPDGVAYAAVATLVHPGFNATTLVNDIALLRVSPPVSEAAPVPVLPQALGFSAANFGETLNFAGFGADEFGGYNVKLQANGTLDGLGCSVPGCYDGGVAATQISYTQYENGPCFGDSGGPAFVNRGGTWYLGGITSYGDNGCTIYGVSTRVDAYEAWIAAFAAPAPTCVADGVCDPACPAGADPDCSTGGGSCGDSVCDAGESCDGRSGTSACASDCPGNTKGKPSGRYCVVGGVCEGPGC